MVAIAERPSIPQRVETLPSVQPSPRKTLAEAWEEFRQRQDEQLLESCLRRFGATESEDKTPGEGEVDTPSVPTGMNHEPAPTGEELRARREAIDVSQQVLADMMPGGKRTTIAEIERGVRNNNLTREKIGNVLNVLEQLDVIPVSISF